MLGKVDIAAAILEFGKSGASLNELQRVMSLSASLLKQHLDLLRSKDLITVKNDQKVGTFVKTTKRGIQFLNLYNSMSVKYLKVTV
ncbi:MAG: hypothetical protein MN733_43950 [Nitrososphaera sp.]|nr:hypothetical protein [Nitrososphaera sp.]